MIELQKVKGNNYRLYESVLMDSIFLSKDELIEVYNVVQKELKELKILY